MQEQIRSPSCFSMGLQADLPVVPPRRIGIWDHYQYEEHISGIMGIDPIIVWTLALEKFGAEPGVT